METPAVPALLIGAIFVEKGLITQEQLEIALEEQRTTGERLGEILVERFGVSRLDLASALADQWAEYERQGMTEQQHSPTELRDPAAVSDEWNGVTATSESKRPIGEIFVEQGLISEGDLAAALEEQQTSGRRLGEVLVAHGKLSRLELASALADQWASFQKLRPPAGAVEQPAEHTPVLPTPEVASVASPPGVRAELEALAGRIAALESSAPQRDLEPELHGLHSELAALAKVVEIAAGSGRVEELRTQVERLAHAVEAQGRRLGAMPLQDGGWRDDVARLAERLDELAAAGPDVREGEDDGISARLEGLAAEIAAQARTVAEVTEWKGEITALKQRVASLADAEPGAVAELRASLDALTRRVDAVPAPSDEWRSELTLLAARVDELAGRAAEGVDELREAVAGLAVRIDEHPGWTAELESAVADLQARITPIASAVAVESEVADVRAGLAALHQRMDALPVPSEEWREQIEQLSSRLDDLAARRPAVLDELQSSVRDIARRIESIRVPGDELRQELDTLAARLDASAENLRDRLDRIEDDVATRAHNGAVAELSGRLDELVARLPDEFVEPSDEWRHELAGVAENLRVRVERVEGGLEQRPGFDTLAALRDEIQQLAGRLDLQAQEGDERNAGLGARLDRLAERVSAGEEAEQRLRDALMPIVDEAVAPLRSDGVAIHARLDEAVRRLDDELASLAGLVPRLAEQDRRLDEQSRRIEELPHDGPSAAEVAEALGSRLDASEAVATDAFSSLDERITALDRRVSGVVAHSDPAVESLRRELDDLRGVIAAVTAASAVHADQLAETLRAEIAAAVVGADRRDELDRLEGLVAGQTTALDALQAELRERGRRSEEKLADRAAELSALRTTLEQLEASHAGAEQGWRKAVDTTADRLDGLEKAQAKRADVHELREALGRIEQRVERGVAEEDTRVKAVEQALRDGLASLGSQLAEREDSYREAGDTLRRSIARLGSAIRAADEHVSPPEAAAPRSVEATSYLAFAPTPDGYRLVECDGPPPAVGAGVQLPEHDGQLVVSRLGASPLPFDGRACAYLEPAG